MLTEARKNELLKITKENIKRSRVICLERVNEAINYPKGIGQDNKIEHLLWKENGYKVTVNKPGKEAAPGYMQCRDVNGVSGGNPNDMYPSILFNDEEINSGIKSFKEVFDAIFSLKKYDKSINLIACLLVRSAYMVDHVKNEKGEWQYNPPIDIINEIYEEVSLIKEIPILAFLHYLDAIGLNEDVKYYTLGYKISDGTGRRNNLMTCVCLIAVILEKYSISKFAGQFSSKPRGISALPKVHAFNIFPYLKPIDEVIELENNDALKKIKEKSTRRRFWGLF